MLTRYILRKKNKNGTFRTYLSQSAQSNIQEKAKRTRPYLKLTNI